MLKAMTDRQQADAEEQVAHALAEIRRIYQQAAMAITGIDDPQAAFECADAFAEELRRLYEQDAAELRNQQVDRIWAEERFVAAALARRINVTKQRASKIVNRHAEQAGKEPT